MQLILLFCFFYFINCQEDEIKNGMNCLNQNCNYEHDKFSRLYNKNRLMKCLHCLKGPAILLTEEEKAEYNKCMNEDKCEIHENLTDKFKYAPELINFSTCMRLKCNIDFDSIEIRPYVLKYRNFANLNSYDIINE